MGMLDKVKSFLGQHADQAKSGVEKAGDAVDKKTGGKIAKHVDTGQKQADSLIDRSKDDA